MVERPVRKPLFRLPASGRRRRRRTVVVFLSLALGLTVWLPSSPAQTGYDIASRQSGPWSNPTTWACSCVPAPTSRLLIRSGHTVTISGQAAAGATIVEGVLRASRTESSVLTLRGNLIVRGQGWLDYGTSTAPIPWNVTARIKWILDESRYVGGHAMEPVATDVGLWVTDDGRVTTKGPTRGAWTTLAATARRNSFEINVDPQFVTQWRVGDEVLIAPTNVVVKGNTQVEDEVRVITQDLGGGRFQLDRALSYEHVVQSVTWTDASGDGWTERMAPAVANLTRNIVFEAADLNHRPHTIFLARSTVQLEDVALIGFSPIPKDIGRYGRRNEPLPFSRYALHFHMQRDGSRGSIVREAVIREGMGNGLHIHDSYGVVVEDLVIHNQARATQYGVPGTFGIMLEELRDRDANRIPDTGANDAWVDRSLVVRWGASNTYRTSGVWLGGGVGAYVVGAHAAGGRGGTGIHWCEGCGNNRSANAKNPDRTPRVLRAATYSTTDGFFWWQNTTPAQDVLDLLAWNNRTGIDIGAYGTAYWVYWARAIGNASAQFTQHADGTAVTNFLADGLGRGGAGVVVQKYTSPSATDTRYERGVVRGVSNAVMFDACLVESRCKSPKTLVQFNRIEFGANPAMRYVWHVDSSTALKVRSQSGLSRPADFTLYRRDRTDVKSVYDDAYVARRVDGDASGAFPAAPRVKMVSPSGCVADDAVETRSITLCAETDARAVEFYLAGALVARVDASGGMARAGFDMTKFPHRRAYFYAKALGENGRHNYSRVVRVRKF
jgi:hypothetical protein